jgi:hypothetical protein
MSYSDKRQRAYFRCARELRAVACEILDDVQTETELRGETAPWALRLAVKVAKDANEIEDRGYELCTCDARTDVPNWKSRNAHGASLDAFFGRLEAALRIDRDERVELCAGWLKPPVGIPS